jgi:hypothetical protein
MLIALAQRRINHMASSCGQNVLPFVLTVSASGFARSASAASNQALSKADAKAKAIAASFGPNYPCPVECQFQAFDIKTVTSTTKIKIIHLPGWPPRPSLTFYLATVTLTFQPIINCIIP